MAPSKIRRALGAVKDQTSIGLAKVGSSASLADLDVAIVKATRHEEQPAEEKHIREILSLTCYSRAFISACVNTLARRLNKTKNWTVALKTLILVQRLLNDGDPAYEQEIFFSTRRGTRFLNMSDFRDSDSSSSSSWDYSAFVRTYALYLDERLEYRMQSRRGRRSAFGLDDDDEEAAAAPTAMALALPGHHQTMSVVKATPVREMKTEQVFSRAQHLMQLLERFLACRPTGAAKGNRIVIVALYPTVRESFQTYLEVTEAMGILVDRFMEMELPDCSKVYDIFCRATKQFDELDLFYNWCKSVGLSRSSDYPDVEKITPNKLHAMDDFIRDRSHPRLTITATIETPEEEEEDDDDQPADPVVEEEQDLNAIRALPAPEDHGEADVGDGNHEDQRQLVQQEGDLLNLGEGGLSSAAEEGDRLALALFDGPAESSAAAAGPGWEAFKEGAAADWETALVETASGLRGGQVRAGTLAGGFDVPMLDGMYMARAAEAARSGFGASGSASSVALGSAGRPTMLALPAPPTSGGGAAGADPFAASLAVAPPAYVQMSEMERKQRLLVEEQMMWQQYARDGMQGQLGMAQLQLQHNINSPYNINVQGGYTRTY